VRESLVELGTRSGIEGLCGSVASRLGGCISLGLAPSMTIVDPDDDEVDDSRTVESV
jgi:hypothetical protein